MLCRAGLCPARLRCFVRQFSDCPPRLIARGAFDLVACCPIHWNDAHKQQPCRSGGELIPILELPGARFAVRHVKKKEHRRGWMPYARR
jgi:hypothetical protein